MKITDNNNNKQKFIDIPIGHTFKYLPEGEKTERLYLKCCNYNTAYFDLNAVELGDYYFTFFNNNTMVTLVDAELVVD